MSLLAQLSTSIRRAARNQKQDSWLGHQLCQGPYLMPAPTGTLWNPGHHLCRVEGPGSLAVLGALTLEDWNDHYCPIQSEQGKAKE